MAEWQRWFTYVDEEAEEAQGLAEYALILSLVALVCIAALTTLGGAISGLIASVVSSL